MKFEIKTHNCSHHSSPFPHCTYSEFFTKDTYTLIINNLPKKESFNRVSYTYDLKNTERFENWPTYNSTNKSTVNSIWNELEDFFSSPKIIKEIFKPFKETIKDDPQLQNYFSQGSPIARVRLVSEQCPFILPPHLDMPFKLLVLVVYLNESGGDENNGTTLYTKNNNGTFTYIKNTLYKENTAVAMLRTSNSWHGGTWDGNTRRTTLHIYYYNANYFKKNTK
jgi:hypothetical protein